MDEKLKDCGHVQSSDFVINFLSAVSAGIVKQGQYVLLCSHGFGFTWGLTLIRV